jgi:4-alpha-glucanotransferase
MKGRGSGILAHITSLYSGFGIGDLGPSAFRFVDFLSDANQRYWQILPINPTSREYDNSPYHSLSAFAFNTNLISPEYLVKDGFLDTSDIGVVPEFPVGRVDFDAVIRFKEKIFSSAYERFRKEQINHGRYHAGNTNDAYDAFCRENSWWLEDFALFTSLKRHYKGTAWNQWPDEIKYRRTTALDAMQDRIKTEIGREKFLQYIFHSQYRALKNYCTQKGVYLIGDLPIYVTYDSADVWTHPELFQLDGTLNPVVVAGVPPDYFSKTGQLWKNPLYCWEEHERSGFSWWIRRIEHNLSLFDYTRIDHFRGLVAYWEVPAGAKDAMCGKWVLAPGEKLLSLIKKQHSDLPIIAEDLGVITPDVSELIDRFGLPGMRVLLFAFTNDPSGSPHAPHNMIKNCLLYTGTHDNATTRGWLESEATVHEKQRLFTYIGRKISPDRLPDLLIRLAMISIADTVIFPLQDILTLGIEARMNRPGTEIGNWRWQLTRDQISPPVIQNLGELTALYGRTKKFPIKKVLAVEIPEK